MNGQSVCPNHHGRDRRPMLTNDEFHLIQHMLAALEACRRR